MFVAFRARVNRIQKMIVVLRHATQAAAPSDQAQQAGPHVGVTPHPHLHFRLPDLVAIFTIGSASVPRLLDRCLNHNNFTGL